MNENTPLTQGGSPSAAPAEMSATAIVGLVFGILAIASSWMPIINNFSFFFALIGVVFSIIGLVGTMKGKKRGKGIAIAALVLNILAVVVVLATQSMYAAALSNI